jgi:N-acetylglucosamine-6-phosphate deacetylase
MLIHAHHYQTGEPVASTIESGRIVAVESLTHSKPDTVADWIAPSFFDIQVNGALGISFNSPTWYIALPTKSRATVSADSARLSTQRIRSHSSMDFELSHKLATKIPR